MRKPKIELLLEQLGTGEDLPRVLEALGLTAKQALDLLESPAGQEQSRAHQRLRRVQIGLCARRAQLEALAVLRSQLASPSKPELQCRCALGALATARQKPGKPRSGEREPVSPLPHTPETAELLQAVADQLTERRRKAAMGPPPDPEPSAPVPAPPAASPEPSKGGRHGG